VLESELPGDQEGQHGARSETDGSLNHLLIVNMGNFDSLHEKFLHVLSDNIKL
jgi:hypothetical protein